MADSLLDRALNGTRFLVLGGFLIAVAGVCAHFQGWPWLQATLGPTAYVLVAHPKTDSARVRNAVIGHTTAIGVGLACLAVFGLWHHPSTSQSHHTTIAQFAASAVAVGVTLFLLEVFDAHHAPAGATTLLLTTGLAEPGSPLYGLVLGLTAVIALGAVVAKVPFRRDAVTSD